MQRLVPCLLFAALLIWQPLSAAPQLDLSTMDWFVTTGTMDPDAVDLADGRWKKARVPGDLVSGGIVPAGTRLVTYAVAISAPELSRERSLSLRLGEISDRDRTFLNGVKLGSTGEWDGAEPSGYDRLRIYEIPPGILKEQNLLVVQVQGWVDWELGIYRDRVELAPTVEIRDTFHGENIFQLAALMVYLTVASYFIFLFLRRRRERENFYFGLLTLALVGYHFLRTQYKYDLDIGFPTLKRIQYLNLFMMAPTFYHFVSAFFDLQGAIRRRFNQGMLVFTILYSLAPAYLLLTAASIPEWEDVNRIVMQPSWIVFALAGLGVMIHAAIRGSRDALFMILGVLVVVVCAVLDVLSSQAFINLPTTLTYGFIAFILAMAVVLANRFVRLNLEVERLNVDLTQTNKAYSRFVPMEFLGHLGLATIIDVRLGQQVEREMTILFSDIRSFTTLSESMTPDENMQFLNSYFKHMTPIVHEYNGFIDKYIGDAIMSLFPESAEDALRASIAMQEDIARYNEVRRERGFQTIQVGIGLHTGMLVLGTIGNAERMDGTVISDAVNLASRIEGLTKMFGASIMLSGLTLSRIPAAKDRFGLRPLGTMQVKGKTEGVPVYEVLDGLPEAERSGKLAGLESFQRALELYALGKLNEAADSFAQSRKAWPGDKAALFYESLIAEQQKFGNWQPMIRLDSK